jgi:hypothetical protein
MKDNGLIDLRKLKSLAEKLLPPSRLLRNLILAKSVYTPRSEGLVEIPMFAKILDEELRSAP